ncbi:MAG: PEP-CTERM sorting domain-containing protein [Myxococcales bacterium]|nr:PEP-CTERM sorting domain-containing protein [Myxococcales bacterium]
MTPYRHARTPHPIDEPGDDETAVGLVMIAVGLVPVVPAALAGGDFGPEPTTGLALVLLGLWTALRRR